MQRMIYLGCLLVGLLSALSTRAQEFLALVVEASGTGFFDSAQVTQLVADCRTYNFNAIIVQMRRNGEAYYLPQAPNGDVRATNIAADYDALAELIAQCHTGTPRIEVHAWVDANLIWRGNTLPSQTNHIFNTNPEFLTKRTNGNTAFPYQDGTNSIAAYYLDPANPAAMTWNYQVAKDIVTRYDIDGFLWDDFHYPARNSGYNDVAIARYNAEFGTTGNPSSEAGQFANWRRRQLTDFLRWTSAELLAIKPDLIISTAVTGNRADGYNHRFEDWSAWNAEGIVDLSLPRVTFSESEGNLNSTEANEAFNHQGIRRVYPWANGFMLNKETSGEVLHYIDIKPFYGYAFESYQEPNSGPANPTATFTYLRDNYQATWLDTPALPWKATPTGGIVRGLVTLQTSGQPIYNATITLVSATNRVQLTGAHGHYAFFEVAPGTYDVVASWEGFAATNEVIITAGDNLPVDFSLGDVVQEPIYLSATPIAESELQLTMTGRTNGTFVIEVSINLTQWSEETTREAGPDGATFNSPITSGGQFYYRVYWRPGGEGISDSD